MALVLGRHVDGEERGLQVEGSGLDAGEILPRMLRHLDGGASLPASNHVPPHVQLKDERLVIGIPTRGERRRDH